MKLVLDGHGYKYAVEQAMLMFYPGERPDYSTGSGEGEREGLSARVRISRGAVYATATTAIRAGGAAYYGRARVRLSELEGALISDRLLQAAVRRSFYAAAVAATGHRPVWGSLTGIRPAKTVARMLEGGASLRAAGGALRRRYRVSPERAELCLAASRAAADVDCGLSRRDVMLYIGIPFCPTRCAYCTFVSSGTERSRGLIEPFLAALRAEMAAAARAVEALGLAVAAVYVGGGTPTVLSPEQLDGVLGHARSLFDLSQAREVTVEAGRPDTITREKLDAMRRRGVTRVSVNPQSMSDAVLRAIGRAHTSRDVIRAFGEARGAGFGDVNMDIIAGLPTDTPQGFAMTLDAVAALGPENITVHTLALKKGSRIALDGTGVPDGNAVSEMLDAAAGLLRGLGYSPYYLYRQKFMSGGFENVGWSLPGHMGVYNVCMMEELRSVIGMGGGGVTKLVCRAGGRIERIFNPKYPLEYTKRIESIIEKKLSISLSL
ncbi:MAG: coproporphyrinogen dehydrogenase HemZ [Oscillospiraceae bacterium]|jgi:oxygen-independent coproporphyrinogen-3 oxidase|nr:coproporphyrinogen dehydrogenase HemZ [Oscillospiraceae bacterium]